MASNRFFFNDDSTSSEETSDEEQQQQVQTQTAKKGTGKTGSKQYVFP